MQAMSLLRGLWLLLGIFTVASVWAQGAILVYDQRDGFPGAETGFRSPWSAGAIGNNSPMPAPTGRIYANNDLIGTTAAVRIRLLNFYGGDSFGRLVVVAGNGFRRTGDSQYQLPGDRSNGLGPANQSGTVQFGTWVGSGHVFGMRAAANDNSLTASAEARADIEFRNAAMLSLVSGPSPVQPNLSSYLWGGNRIDPTAFPIVTFGWASGAITGARPLIGFELFGQRASSHSDRLILRTTLSILRNGSPFYTDVDQAFADWSAGDGTINRSIGSVGDTYTLNIQNDPNNTQYQINLRVQVLHEGYRDNFASLAGTATLYDQTFSQSFIVFVPEPASMVALGTGLVSLLALRRRRR